MLNPNAPSAEPTDAEFLDFARVTLTNRTRNEGKAADRYFDDCVHFTAEGKAKQVADILRFLEADGIEKTPTL